MSKIEKKKKEERKAVMGKIKGFHVLFLLTLFLQAATAFYFCTQKQGFHEDEYYTYYSTARTGGLIINEDTWIEQKDFYKEFVVLEGEQFQYGLVKQVQSWDVHPPVYYWIFHTVCSLFPEQFSKWFGLVPNLLFFAVGQILLWKISLLMTKENEKLSWLICLFYGFTPAVVSSVVFIRMYALLTVFVLLCAILHMQAVGAKEQSDKGAPLSWKTFLLPLAVVTYLGFLTQYYYFIFLFFMAAGFCIYLLWKDRTLWNCLRYGGSLAVAFLLAYLTYPSCLGQMFRGQRGAQATNNFFDFSNTWERLSFFGTLLDEYVFGGLLPILLLLLFLLWLTVRFVTARSVRREKLEDTECKTNGKSKGQLAYGLLFAAVLGYFLTVSKTALLLGNTSVRYQTPIYGMVVLLLFSALRELGVKYFAGKWQEGSRVWTVGFWIPYGIWLAAALAVLVNFTRLFSGWVVFLYPEDMEQTAFAKEQAKEQAEAVYLYDIGQSWCVWDCANELFAYDKVYFADCGSREPITDKEIAESDALVVYVSNTTDTEEALERILAGNQKVSHHELQYREKYCDVYLLY